MNPEFSKGPPNNLERPKNPSEKLGRILADIAGEINREEEARHGLQGLLNSDCTVAVEGFAKSRGGIYEDAVVTQSQKEIAAKELEFSRADNAGVQKYYQSSYGVTGQEAIVTKWRQNKLLEKSSQMEMAVTILLYKFLKDNYIVVRTSTYDDYVNGVDNLIMDKRTGAVICAFDEVHEGGEGDRTAAKQEKVIKKAKRGGAKVRFGLRLGQGKIERSKIDSLPVFYLGLSSQELSSLLSSMGEDINSAAEDTENRIFSVLVESLRRQKQILDAETLPVDVKNKLDAFEHSLREMESEMKPKALH